MTSTPYAHTMTAAIQHAKIAARLSKGTVSSNELKQIGIANPSARVRELQNRGFNIRVSYENGQETYTNTNHSNRQEVGTNAYNSLDPKHRQARQTILTKLERGPVNADEIEAIPDSDAALHHLMASGLIVVGPATVPGFSSSHANMHFARPKATKNAYRLAKGTGRGTL